MTKSGVINNIYEKYYENHLATLEKDSDKVVFTKTLCEEILDMFAEEIKDCLVRGDKLLIKGFLGFEVTERPVRDGRNPNTGEVVKFPAVKTVKCKVAQAIKDAVNGK